MKTTAPLQRLIEIKANALQTKKGHSVAWKAAGNYFRLHKGYPFYLGGIGGVGKTEFLFDMVINASIQHSWRWLILSPESGNATETFELILRKISRGKEIAELTESELMANITWMQKHFRVIDPMENWRNIYAGLDINLENLESAIKSIEAEQGWRYDGVVIDPFNELDFKPDTSIMNHVKTELDVLNYWARKRNICPILTNHVNDKQEVRSKSNDGEVYFWTPPAKKEEWAYGQQFGRKGYQMILLYEPHPVQIEERALSGDESAQYSLRHFHEHGFHILRDLYIQKTKPKGLGRTGRVSLLYDARTQRYFEHDLVNIKNGIIWPTLVS